MKASDVEVLRDALADRHSNETFEKTLGRIVRRHGGTFEDYMRIVGLVRDRAKRTKGSLVAAAEALAGGTR